MSDPSLKCLFEASKYRDRSLSTFGSNMVLPRHRWYDFKEGFSEELVREAIGDVAPDGRQVRLLDPFAGSGTTLVAAGRLGHEAVGIEVNPFLAFAAEAKCTPDGWVEGELNVTLQRILGLSAHETPSPLEGQSTFTEGPQTKRWLFHRSVLRGFTAVDRALADAGPYRAPLRLALFASLMDCCNAKRDGKCLRYRRNWRSSGITSAELLASFQVRVRVVAHDVMRHPFDAGGLRVIQGDAREELPKLPDVGFDLIVTSPPYLNSFDYSDVYRPELFAGEFVRTNTELRQIRLKTLRSHVQVAWEPSAENTSAMLIPIVQRIMQGELWDRRIPDMVRSYFADLAGVMGQASRVVRPGGQAWIVVATSAYAGVHVPVDLILADVAVQRGWELKGVHVLRQLRSAGQYWAQLGHGTVQPLRESLVIMRRPA